MKDLTTRELILEIRNRLFKLEKIMMANRRAESQWLSAEEIQMEFGRGFSPATIASLRKAGKLKYKSKNGRNFKYNRKDIESLMLRVA